MLALWIEGATALLTVAGIAYMALALWGARDFARSTLRRNDGGLAPDVTILNVGRPEDHTRRLVRAIRGE